VSDAIGGRAIVDLSPVQSRALEYAIAAGALAFVLGVYARSVDPLMTEVPVIASHARWFYLAALGAALAFGAVIQRDRELGGATPAGRRSRMTAGILPGVALLSAALLTARDGRWAVVIAAAVLAATSVYATLIVRAFIDADDRDALPAARAAHLVITCGAAFLTLSLVYLYKTRTLYSGPVVFLVSALLLAQAHEGLPIPLVRRGLYAIAGAIGVAEAVWGLNYWPAAGWWGGVVLAAIFVVLTLVTGARFERRLSRDRAVVYATSGAAVVAVAAFLAGD
jgi:hypothetical protein